MEEDAKRPKTQVLAPTTVNSVREGFQGRTTALAVFGAWGDPAKNQETLWADEYTAPDSSHDHAGVGRRSDSRESARPALGSQGGSSLQYGCDRTGKYANDLQPGSSESDWSHSGLQRKTNIVAISRTPRDGLLGIITEIPVERDDSRASSRPQTGGGGLSSRPHSRPDTRDRAISTQSGIVEGEVQRRKSRFRNGASSSDGKKQNAGEGNEKNRKSYRFDRRICFRLIRWPEWDDLPDLPATNMFGMSISNPIRGRLIKLSVSLQLERFWMLVTMLHFAIALSEVQERVLGCSVAENHASFVICKYSLPSWYHIVFLVVFCIEAGIKTIGLGFSGGKFAWWTQDVFNKLDILALLAYFYETLTTVLPGNSSNFSLRGFRIMRLLKPLAQLGVFADLETIVDAFGAALKPMATVLLFIWFVLILFGIMGMAIWGKSSFRRRCVWADTLQVKEPLMHCKRLEVYQEYPGCVQLSQTDSRPCLRNPLRADERRGTLAGLEAPHKGLDSNCGPFQLCLDMANPNMGFTSFDHLPGSLITLFQVLSGDNDVLVLWGAIDSEPALGLMTRTYFMVYLMFVVHVLINVFVAVFASVFADARLQHEERVEKRRRRHSPDSETWSTVSSSSSSSLSNSYIESNARSRMDSGAEKIENQETQVATDEAGVKTALQKQLELRQKQAETEAEEERIRKYVGSRQWLFQHFERPCDPSTQNLLKYVFRGNDIYDTLFFLTTLAQATSLALTGQMCSSDTEDCPQDNLFAEIVQKANIFFIVDFAIQVMCDGSIANHFGQGENIFNFIVTVMTTAGLLLNALGLSKVAVTAFTGFAILRVLRMCKYFFLKPVWLMMIKAAGSMIPVMNLVLFNTLFTMLYYAIGRSLLKETRLDKDNFRYNYSSISRGYMLLLTVLSGDGWSATMYEAMSMFCTGITPTDTCDNFYVVISAVFYMSWFFYGQFLFITMFLAIILEAFSVDEFMTSSEAEDADLRLDENAAREVVATFQKIPVWSVHPGLIRLAFLKLSDEGTTVPKSKLLTFTRMIQPMTTWRILKSSGIILGRQFLRKVACTYLSHTCLAAYPGDDDYVREIADDEDEANKPMSVEEAELVVAHKLKVNIATYMKKLVQWGMAGEVLVIAKSMGLLEHLDSKDLHCTEPFIALKILRHADIAKRLDIVGFFEGHMEEVLLRKRPSKLGVEAESFNEYAGLNLAAVNDGVEGAGDETLGQAWARQVHRFRAMSLDIVNTKWFSTIMLCTILLSSVFLCLETPHRSIPGIMPPFALDICDIVFNGLFTFEAVVKIAAWGFYCPRSVINMSYMQSVQNQIDLVVLVFAIAEMTGAGAYIGKNATRSIRLMKVMRPVRLLLRSDGLKNILEALIASLKPMAYATLFIVIVCLMFSVPFMALFRNKFHICSDFSFDGRRGQGQWDCVGQFDDSKVGFYRPRVWAAPPFGHNFDTLGSSVAVLFRCLTLSWSVYFTYAQDAYQVGLQPVPGHSMVMASLIFHLFLLVGSFFGLNLFASFMCDTFYSLQGTAQLEEVQYKGVQAMLAAHQPKKIRLPPKNILSTMLREILSSVVWKNGSAFCLLLNVTFMGSTHSTQNSDFDLFLDTQNTVFFSFMCSEALLHLLSLGPILYVINPAHQFDIFMITVTTFTMLFQDSLRSLSQVTRILRLFKFLRALAKDKTISNVLETVSVSLGQVGNIAIILIVLIVMLAVLAVQLFGTIRMGNRLGRQANFGDFSKSAHTIFQLMFGEDMPTLWDDCSVSEPSCTPAPLDSNGNEIMPSDCAASLYNAAIFFPMVLILTNYVMLNLFVGMIMNNFAYISTKDGNGAVEEEHFIDSAHQYVQHLDPNLVCQIPLEKVYQFYNLVGAPLGNYGISKNNARYLCIREELRQKMKDDEFQKFSWWYENAYLPIQEREEHETTENMQEWKRTKDLVLKLEGEYRDAVGCDREALEQVGLIYDGESSDNEENETQNAPEQDDVLDDDEQDIDDGAFEQKSNTSKLDQADHDSVRSSVHGSSMGYMHGEGEDSRVREEPGLKGKRSWISGGNMGQKPGVRVKKIKNRQSISSMKAIERQLAGESPQLVDVDAEAQKLLIANLKKQYLHAKNEAENLPEPKPSFSLRILRVFKYFLSLFLPYNERNLRRKGHVHYNEMIIAMLYWNKERNIVPQKQMEARKDRDNVIKYEVAFQIIAAVCRGGILRRRRRILKASVQEKLARGRRKIVAIAYSGYSEEHVNKLRREKQRADQDDHAKTSVHQYAMDDLTEPFKALCCKIVTCELALGHELADAVEELSVPVGPHGIFELDEEILSKCFEKSPYLQDLHMRTKAIAQIQELISTSDAAHLAPSYFKIIAVKHGIQIGEHFENLHKASLVQLRQLLDDPHIQSIIPKKARRLPSDGLISVPTNTSNVPGGPGMVELTRDLYDGEQLMNKIEAEESFRKEILQLRQEFVKKEQYQKELNVVLQATTERAADLESKVARDRGRDIQHQQHHKEHHHHHHLEARRGNAQPVAPSRSYDASHAILPLVATHCPSRVCTSLLPGQPEPMMEGDNFEQKQDAGRSHLDALDALEIREALEDEIHGRPQSNHPDDSTHDEHKLQASLQIAQADMDRLSRQLAKAEQLAAKLKQKDSQSNQHLSPNYEKRMAEARARRANKDIIEVDSESALGGLISPRDKALRTDVRKKEAAKVQKIKLLQQAKRAAAQAKTGGGGRGSAAGSAAKL